MTIDWRPRAGQLADQLRASGVLRSPPWDAAIRAVPRHVFVPRYVEQRPDGRWRTIDRDDPDSRAQWLDAVYSDRPLTTALQTGDDGQAVAISSSTKPSLMVRMLETSEVGDTDRVLEIGTGTSYNAALLCHRLGDRQVASIDIEDELAAVARTRLAHVGYTPTLAAGDGTGGLPEAMPYDQIIATCSVSRVPSPWIEQLAPAGRILVDFKITGAAGNLVDLRRDPAGLVGRFLPTWAGFMPLRQGANCAAANPAPIAIERPTTTPNATPWWDNTVVWFLAALQLPDGITTGMRLDPRTAKPMAARMHARNGDWAEIPLEPDEKTGHRTVTGSAGDLWRHVEDAYKLWRALGEPGWDRLGLTVADGKHTIWFDRADGNQRWYLP